MGGKKWQPKKNTKVQKLRTSQKTTRNKTRNTKGLCNRNIHTYKERGNNTGLNTHLANEADVRAAKNIMV